ncbi:cytochrome c biogenesis CcdA family protein [Mycobacterium botniense]|uniref:Cytochrome C biogenesis protein transmembrane domain-containing protein n=1 Tax=Mycobacterium botniense TaxID=84962 RepID=A0A7I9XU32_9MYCO|nr:cytochrome c biogenesis CcdA family protein [Mycobacterium botniense]GFG73512.1 hypothetical protein MBOT_08770 [Mycobacterium botniense]
MIDTAALGFALGAGLVAALNPCGFALLPGYLGLVIAEAQDISRGTALARAAAATVMMALGFLTVFGIFGLVISPAVASAEKYLPFATVVIGVVLIAMAIWLLVGKDINAAVPKLTRGTPTRRLGSMYGYGVSYAVASLSCTLAPFLAVISTTFKQGLMLSGILAFLAYTAGMTATVGAAALGVALAGSSAGAALRRILPYVGRIAGVVVLLTGLYVTYYGYYEIRVYFADAAPDDPVVHIAGIVQSWLVHQVDKLGVWPLLGMAALFVAAAFRWRSVSRWLHRHPDATSDSS